MEAGVHPADVLLLAVLVAPIALYFIFLGLVNSQARPCLVSSRADFAGLTCALLPLVAAPMAALARAGMWWMVALHGLLVGLAFARLLPGRSAGWVVYNISAEHGRKIVEEALREAGWGGRWRGRTWRGAGGGLSLTSFPLLRNVTIHLDPPPDRRDPGAASLARALEGRLRGVEQLPSAGGACMVMLGVGLLMLPLWMMGRHIQDLVDAVNHLLG